MIIPPQRNVTVFNMKERKKKKRRETGSSSSGVAARSTRLETKRLPIRRTNDAYNWQNLRSSAFSEVIRALCNSFVWHESYVFENLIFHPQPRYFLFPFGEAENELFLTIAGCQKFRSKCNV